MDFINKKDINNFDIIINAIINDINFEHIGDIIYLLDKYDKKRDLESLELKNAVYLVIKTIVEDYNFIAVRFINVKKKVYFKTIEEIFVFLNENWYISDIREYLIFFIKPKNLCKLPQK